MKSQVAVILMAVVLVGLVFGVSGVRANLVANGDFEGGWSSYAPAGWDALYYGTDAIFSPTGDVKHSGNFSAALQHGVDNGNSNPASVPGYVQVFSVLPTDTTIHFEVWLMSFQGATLNARIREAGGNPDYFPRFFNRNTNDWATPTGSNYIVNNAGWRGSNYDGDFCSQASTYQTIQAAGTGTWTKYQIDIPVLSGVTNYKVELMADLNDKGTMLFVDDVVVTAIPEPATMALVSLGGLGLLRRRSK